RRLGSHLGAGATSLYWHVANKDDLLELAIDEVLGEVYVPDPGDTSWRIGASVLANGMRDALLRHPWVTGLLGAKPTLGPTAIRPRRARAAAADGGRLHRQGGRARQSAAHRALDRFGDPPVGGEHRGPPDRRHPRRHDPKGAALPRRDRPRPPA